MKLRDNGDTAFPFTVEPGRGTSVENHYGMSLRDWFAGQALTGLALNQKAYDFDPEGMAQWSFKVADAMLEARKS